MEPLGPKLASGRDADIFEHGPGLVLRRSRQLRPLVEEAGVMRRVAASGYPVPRVEAVDGPDLVMERVDGPTMLEDLTRRPWALKANAAVLADLHRRLGPVGVVHRDLHPGNVILSARGPVVIDWSNAVPGPGDLDVAHTWLIMATSDPGNRALRLVAKAFRGYFLRHFLHGFDMAAVRGHLPAVAAHRLADRNLLPPERAAIPRFLAANGMDCN